ncbi:MAG: murein transglycosylase A [Nitrospinota bacterium]
MAEQTCTSMLTVPGGMSRRRSPVRLVAGICLLVLGATGCGVFFGRPAPRKDRLVLEPVSFKDLPGWRDGRHAGAILAFRKSCERLERQPDDRPLGGASVAGRIADWRAVCAAAAKWAEAGPRGDEEARAFFERWFVPLRATNRGDPRGLFTGYYEPVLRGARTRGGRFTVPIYRRPPDLVTVDLGLFRRELRGRRIAGRVVGGELRPYDDRAAINAGTLEGRGLELVWVDDPVAAFFLHVQGSGRVILKDGEVLRLGYDAQNGHPYRAIGRDLIDRGVLSRASVSLQTIRAWMKEHPEEARKLMERNPSYVFFRRVEGDGPVGAQGAVLTPLRSLAVDRRFIPLGVPLWVDTTAPAATPGGAEEPEGSFRPLRRLFIAQDTGGAIRGPVRGDVFWGSGPEAEAAAGRMKQEGEYYLLLPRALVIRGFPAL